MLSDQPTTTQGVGLVAADLPICGIVMPISTKLGSGSAHWEDVLTAFLEVAAAALFQPHLVSSAAQVGLVQQRIVRDLYTSPLVICDISGKHPHVMFELGMRLAFNRPTIIVKDDQTDYSLADCPIEHLEYPYDLGHPAMMGFRRELTRKLESFHHCARIRQPTPGFLEQVGAGEQLTPALEAPPHTPDVPRALQATREALQKFTRPRPSTCSVVPPRPIVELHGWKTCDVQGIISEVAPAQAREIVVTRSDCGHAHYLLLPMDLPAASFVRDLGLFSGPDSVRLLG